VESNRNLIYIGLGVLALAVLAFMTLDERIMRPVLYVFLLLASIFLVLLVLIQRGRGGGLAGALGGMGGYSAFGTRAGDIFTRITIVAAAFWILAAMGLAKLNVTGSQKYVNPVAPPATGAADKDRSKDLESDEGSAGSTENSGRKDTSSSKPESSTPKNPEEGSGN